MAAEIWWPVEKLVWEAFRMNNWSTGEIIAALTLLVAIGAYLVKITISVNGKLDKKEYDRNITHCQETCTAKIEGLREGHDQVINQVYGRIDANRAETQATLNTLIQGMGELKGMISVLITNQGKNN